MKPIKNGKTAKAGGRRDGVAIRICALALLIIVCAVFGFELAAYSDGSAAEEFVGAAARQVSSQLSSLIDSGVMQMKVAVDAGEDAPAALEDRSMFSQVTTEITSPEGEKRFYSYAVDGIEAHLRMLNDGQLELRIPCGETRALIARIGAETFASAVIGAFPDDCGYILYNEKTGGYLWNRSHFADESYYASILARNDLGDMEQLLSGSSERAHILKDPSFANESYYLAQAHTTVDSWSVALIVPDRYIGSAVTGTGGKRKLAIVMPAVTALLILGLAAYCLRVLADRKKCFAQRTAVLEELLNDAASCGKMVVLDYNRNGDAVGRCYGSIADTAGTAMDLHAVAERCGIARSGFDTLRSRIGSLTVGEKADMRVSSAEDDSRSVNVSMKCLGGSADRLALILRRGDRDSSVYDRKLDEELYLGMMRPKCSAIWTVNADRDLWSCVYCKHEENLKPLGVEIDAWRSYTDDRSGFLRGIIHPDDMDLFTEKLSSAAIKALYQADRTETVYECRVMNHTRRKYEWSRQLIRVYKDPESGEVFANLFLQNVDAEKKAEFERRELTRIANKALTALGGIYYGLFYVELDEDRCYTAKAPDGEMLTQICASYRETFEDYAARQVHPDDREELLRLLDAYALRRGMSETRHSVKHKFRRLVGEEYKPASLIIQAARLENGSVRDVVVALQDLEDQ